MAGWPQLIRQGHLTVKGDKASESQTQIMALIDARARRRGAKVEDVAGAIATAVQESECRNLTAAQSDPTPGTSSAGVYQQQASWGSYAQRTDPVWAIDKFLSIYLPYRQRGYGWLKASDETQHSAHPDEPARWWEESLRAARFFSGLGASVTSKTAGADGGVELTVTRELPYEFARGSVNSRENSLEASGRLADEVEWDRYIQLRPVSAQRAVAEFCFVNEPWLAAHKPRYRLSESSRGVLDISFEIEGRLPAAEATLQVIAGMYDLQLGMVVELFDEGPGDGDWLVASTRGSHTSPVVEVTLKRPGRKLPEPAPETETLSGTVAADGTRQVTGGTGTLQGVPEKVSRAYQAADYYTSLKMPYAHDGHGRHGLVAHPSPNGDCSSGVSWVLWQAGIALPGGVTSGHAPTTAAYPGWGETGKGRWFTVWVRYYGANAHMWIQWHCGSAWRFDTGDSLAPHQQHKPRSTDGFVALHPPGL